VRSSRRDENWQGKALAEDLPQCRFVTTNHRRRDVGSKPGTKEVPDIKTNWPTDRRSQNQPQPENFFLSQEPLVEAE
jgi:hypothetical protein